jgi:hypothetical protein
MGLPSSNSGTNSTGYFRTLVTEFSRLVLCIMHDGLLQEHMHDAGVSEAAMGAAGGAAGASDCLV